MAENFYLYFDAEICLLGRSASYCFLRTSKQSCEDDRPVYKRLKIYAHNCWCQYSTATFTSEKVKLGIIINVAFVLLYSFYCSNF